ncbi:MAG TPA: purine-nucleoside phosphorylase [Candidatus Limnocylindria bacterium]|nr:purine-nucleoside phosphorylase [Candidatus Limnocylindria bacterium]
MTVSPFGALPDGLYGAELERRIGEAAQAIRDRLSSAREHGSAPAEPRLAIILGSGLGGVVELLEAEPRLRIPYREIPHVPGASVAGHAGELVLGCVGELPVAVMSGRAHVYEGYSQRQVTLLLRAVIRLGIETLLVTNAAGGLDPAFDPGEVMLIDDVINLSGDNPLRGPNLDRFGPRFPAMTDALDPELRAAARDAAAEAGVPLRRGVYVMLSGPAYETRAEMRMLRGLGADAVGMSTVPEVMVARHAGVRVLGFSLVTNKATDDVEAGATHEEVIEMGRIGAERLVGLLARLLPRLR